MFLHRDKNNNSDQRTKNHIPDLEKFLIYLVIHPKLQWKDIWADYLKETFIRNVYWMTKNNKQLLDLNLNIKSRLELTYKNQNNKTSMDLISFQVYFLNNIASPKGITKHDILNNYKYTFGRPKQIDLDNLQKYCINIKNKNKEKVNKK